MIGHGPTTAGTPRTDQTIQSDRYPSGPHRTRGYSCECVATAYHEAGHAAVAVLLGSQLDGVELTPDHPHCSGCCREKVDDPIALARAVERGDEAVIRPQIHILLAGRAAQQKGECDWFPGGDDHDLTAARWLAARLGTGDDVILAKALIETRRLLDRPAVWAGVEALVNELLLKGRIDGVTAHRILDTAGSRADERHAATGSCPW